MIINNYFKNALVGCVIISLYIFVELINSSMTVNNKSVLIIGNDFPCRTQMKTSNKSEQTINLIDANSVTPTLPKNHYRLLTGTFALLSVMPILLSGCDKFNQAKINAWLNLGLGHVVTWFTSTSIKNILCLPDLVFYHTCHLTYENCIKYKNQSMLILENIPNEPNANQTIQLVCILPNFYNHLYSEPNVGLCLVGAFAITFMFNLCQFETMSLKLICNHTKKVKIALMLCIFLLLFCLGVVFLEIQQSIEYGKNDFVSIVWGVLNQVILCFIFY